MPRTGEVILRKSRANGCSYCLWTAEIHLGRGAQANNPKRLGSKPENSRLPVRPSSSARGVRQLSDKKNELNEKQEEPSLIKWLLKRPRTIATLFPQKDAVDVSNIKLCSVKRYK